MGSKAIALTGLAVSAALIYFCIDLKKDRIAVACHIGQETSVETGKQRSESEPVAAAAEVPAEVPEEEAKAVYEKSDPAFGIAMGDAVNIVGMFSPDEKHDKLIAYIDGFCKVHNCMNDIRFSEDIKSVTWDDTMIDVIDFFQEEHIAGASIYINSNVAHIEGEIDTPAKKRKLESLIAKLSASGLRVENDTADMAAVKSEPVTVAQVEEEVQEEAHVVEEKPVQEVSQKIAEEPQVKQVKSAETSVAPEPVITKESRVTASSSDPQQQIETLLQSGKIAFADRGNRLTQESRKLLDEIAEIAGGKPVVVNVYVHEGNDQMVNMIIAQKRADIIASYLRRKGVHVTASKGAAASETEERIEINVK